MARFGAQQHTYSERKLASTTIAVALLFGTAVITEIFHPHLPKPEIACASAPQPAPALPPPATTQVLVPLQEIDSGTALSPDLFETRLVLADLVPEGVLVHARDIEGMVAQRRLERGRLLFPRDLAQASSELRFDIPVGYRAVSLRVDSTTSVEGFARPGATVDVNFIYTEPNGEKAVTTLVHNAKVVSINGATTAEDFIPTGGNYPITLVVSERDAKAIHLGADIGTLSLSLLSRAEQIVSDPTLDSFTLPSLLRNPQDGEPAQTFTPVPTVVRTTPQDGGREQILITNRVQTTTPEHRE